MPQLCLQFALMSSNWVREEIRATEMKSNGSPSMPRSDLFSLELTRIPSTYNVKGDSGVGLDTPSENLPKTSPEKPWKGTPGTARDNVSRQEMSGSGWSKLEDVCQWPILSRGESSKSRLLETSCLTHGIRKIHFICLTEKLCIDIFWACFQHTVSISSGSTEFLQLVY